ncbi:galactoside 2-alpha-L-fucosyltransferase Sec1-like [Saccostrea echinata]|uniref:galactoside 2-alpha-L-fucosyltransferase Sec1-like n=1 Tax=Saccostrea echinata TaxID=191078 RepID=UPI002A80367D|nr:galactoside 2-alpha-L-fucosyltransferase Sec1-like [Saccostrea echinata]
MNVKRYSACIAASFFATVVAFGTLLTVNQRFGPDHLKPMKILKVIIQSNKVSPNDVIEQNYFRDPPPKKIEINMTQTSARGATSNTALSINKKTVLSPKSFPALTSKTSISPVTSTKTAFMGVSKPSSIPKSTLTTAKSTMTTTKSTVITTKNTVTIPVTKTSISPTTHAPSNFYVCPTFMGRIGNNLFQFASGFGIAASKDMKFVIAENDLINRLFELKNSKHLLISKDRHECAKAKVRGEGRACSYDKNVANFKPDATYRVGNYLQSWKYFHDAAQELREQLKFRIHLQTSANNIIKGILKNYNTSRENVTLIAVHVRRGDMVNHAFGYLVATKEYFAKAVQLFSNYSSPIFIVCSNDLGWSKANFPKNYKVEFISGNSAEVDLALMASCDHMISSVGSFSWWAGWLNNGTVTYYKWPAKEGSGLRAQFSSDYMDYFYPHWTGL